MAADGSKGPRPFTQRTARTTFIRVPNEDWGAVKRGTKREFRGGAGRTSQMFNVVCPTPVVAYRVNRKGEHDARLMVLESARLEVLGEISPESLAAEGFFGEHAYASFKRYWIRRERKFFQPTRKVFVYQVRPWQDGDFEQMGSWLIDHLYGDWL